jgi:membrane protein implicated in regulation of membrane protease activity
MDIMQFLDGISPWWWVALALALGAVEMATMSFFLIWPALAALCVAGFLAISPQMAGTSQIVIFAGLGILFTFSGRYLMARYGDGGGALTGLNLRSKRLVGRNATVLEFLDAEGVVEVEGIRWRAIWPEGQTAKVGDRVRVTGADGMTLSVESPKT